jgi:hypothetical protein
MSIELKGLSAPWSRRGLVLAAAAAAGSVILIGAKVGMATAAYKISENAVAYQDHPNGDKQCSKCAQFLPPSSCKMVDGTISPNGYCRIFAARQSAALPSRRASTFTG